MYDTSNMTYEEYFNAVRSEFDMGAKSISDVESYFQEQETIDYIKEAYEYRNEPESSIYAVASCLDMMY